MSIDGVGLLDSDIAHDVYQTVLDLYDAGASLEQIQERVSAFELGVTDALELECLLAAGVKVFWEIGHLDDALLMRLQQLVESGESLALWLGGGEENLAKGRHGILKRLLKQVGQPKARPRPRRRYPQVRHLMFELGDCLEMSAGGRVVYAVVCRIRQHRGRCDYAILVMSDVREATLAAFHEGRFVGHYVWHFERGNVPGPHVIFLDHAMLVREGSPFRIVARVSLDAERFTLGSFGGVMCLQDVVDDFERTLARCNGTGQRPIPLAELLSA